MRTHTHHWLKPGTHDPSHETSLHYPDTHLAERHQRYCALVHHRRAGALEQGQNDLDVFSLLPWVLAAHLQERIK